MDSTAGRTAVVTGAASGIGRGLVEAALARGMNVLAADVAQAPLENLAAELAAGDRLRTQLCDVTRSEAVAALADEAFTHFGAVHLLFNNAGVLTTGRAWEQTPAEWSWVLSVNVMGAVHGAHHFLPRMLASGEPGVLVNTASMGGLLASADLAAYSASKAALISFSEALLYDLQAVGGKVSAAVICPGAVKTAIMRSERLRDEGEVVAHRSPGLRNAFEAAMDQVGMAPREMAEIVFAELLAGKFWIFPHPEMLKGAQVRLNSMVDGDVPVYRPMAPS